MQGGMNMTVTFPYYCRAGKGDSGGGEVDVELTETECNRLFALQGDYFHLSECNEIGDISEKVMNAVREAEVSIYADDDDLLEELFDGEEISEDPDDIWEALTDRYEYGANFPNRA